MATAQTSEVPQLIRSIQGPRQLMIELNLLPAATNAARKRIPILAFSLRTFNCCPSAGSGNCFAWREVFTALLVHRGLFRLHFQQRIHFLHIIERQMFEKLGIGGIRVGMGEQLLHPLDGAQGFILKNQSKLGVFLIQCTNFLFFQFCLRKLNA